MALNKDGLVNALDFTKYIVTFDTGLIAFLTGTAFLQKVTGRIEKTAVVVTIFFLAVSLIAGIIVYMRAAIQFSNNDYDLENRYLRVPGLINVVCFSLGALGVGILAVIELILK